MEEELVTIRMASPSFMVLLEMSICSHKKSLFGNSRVSICLDCNSTFLIIWLKGEGFKIQDEDRQLCEVIVNG